MDDDFSLDVFGHGRQPGRRQPELQTIGWSKGWEIDPSLREIGPGSTSARRTLTGLSELLVEAGTKEILGRSRSQVHVGGWNLVIDSDHSWDYVPTPTYQAVIPYAITVQFGSGQASQAIELDAKNISVWIPANYVRVVLSYYAPLPSNPGYGYALPSSSKFRASLCWGSAPGHNVHKTTLLPIVATDAAGAASGKLPPFARCARIWASSLVAPRADLPFFADPDSSLVFRNEQFGDLIRYPSAVLLDPSGVRVPASAESWEIIGPSGIRGLRQLEFDLAI